MLATKLSGSGISLMHSDGDADLDIVSSVEFLFFRTTICHFFNPCICIPIPVKRLFISRSPSSYSLMSWHSQLLQYMPFVVVITHQGSILLRHMHYCKTFWKSLSITIIRQKSNIASWREKCTSSARWQEAENSWWASCIEIIWEMPEHTRNSIKVEALGPTSDAAQQHVLQIYHQIQEWGRGNALDPLKWGWQLTKLEIMSIKMTKQVAPTEPLKIVKCGYKTDCLQKICTCRQYGVVCTNISLGYRGVSRMNC